MKTTLMIKGTHCAACKMLIESVCLDISGVNSCNVDYKTGITLLDHSEDLDLGLVKNEVESLGDYKISVLS